MNPTSVSVARTETNPHGFTTVDAPAANLSAAIEEQMRRTDARDAAASAAAPPANAGNSAAIKERFMREHTGFFLVHHANLEYPMRCMVPNMRYVDFYEAASTTPTDIDAALRKAQARVRTLSKDPRLRGVIHNIVPANVPHLIPYSEASARDPAHVLPKINRNANRHVRFTEYRNKEFARRLERTKAYTDSRKPFDEGLDAAPADEGLVADMEAPNDLEMSEYHRWKTYLSRRRTLRLSSATTAPTVEDGDDVTAATALREVAAEGRAVMERIRTPGDVELDFVPPTPIPGLEAFMNASAAPEPVWSDANVPEALAAPPGADDDNELPEWPRDLERRARFMNLAIIDDLDIGADSPEHPGAAGMELMVIPFGGMYETEEEAKDVARDAINPWAQDLKVNTVCLYGFLFPTEVDPDKLKEEHRTGNAGNDAEMKLVMDQNKLQKNRAARARGEAAAANVVIPETNVNAALPDVDEVVAHDRAAVSLAGDVVQLPRVRRSDAPAPSIQDL